MKAILLAGVLLALLSLAHAQSTGGDVLVVAGDCSQDPAKCTQLTSSYLPSGGSGDYAIALAMRAIGRVRYDFGADSSSFNVQEGTGIADCSSFVQGIVREGFGRRIPRTAYTQYRATVPIPLGSQRAGDLIFFRYTYNADNPLGISHVGIVVDGCRFIHAGNPVKWGNYCSGTWAPGNGKFYAITRIPVPGQTIDA